MRKVSGSIETNLGVGLRFPVGQQVKKKFGDRISQQLFGRRSSKFLRGIVDQRNAAVEPGCDQSAADGLDDVLVQDLKIFQRPAGVFQLHSRLAQLGGQQAREISNGEEGKQIYENDSLQRLQPGMGGAIGCTIP